MPNPDDNIYAFALKNHPEVKNQPREQVIAWAKKNIATASGGGGTSPLTKKPSFGETFSQTKGAEESSAGEEALGKWIGSHKMDIAMGAGSLALSSLLPEIPVAEGTSYLARAGVGAVRAAKMGGMMGGLEAARQGAEKLAGAPEAPQSLGQAAGRVATTAAVGAGAQGAADVAPAVARGVGAGAKWVGREAIRPLLDSAANVSKEAMDAISANGDAVLRYAGIDPEALAAKGKDIVSALGKAKDFIEKGYRKKLASHFDTLAKTEEALNTSAAGLKAESATAAQDLQKHISTLRPTASANYSSALNDVLNNNGKYAPPFAVDLNTPTQKVIADTQKRLGRDLAAELGVKESALPQAAKAKLATFDGYANLLKNAGAVSAKGAHSLQQMLSDAVSENTDARGVLSPFGTSLLNLKHAVMDGISKAIPEIAPANTEYAKTLDLAERLKPVANADNPAAAIRNLFDVKKAGGIGSNKADTLKQLAGSSPDANGLLKQVIEKDDAAADLAAKAKEINHLKTVIGAQKDTYQLGQGKNAMLKAASKDPVIKRMLAGTAAPEEDYKQISGILSADNPTAAIVKAMNSQGVQRDALLRLADKSAPIKAAIQDAQNATYGSEISPWVSPRQSGIPGIGANPIARAVAGFGGATRAIEGAGVPQMAGNVAQVAGARAVAGASAGQNTPPTVADVIHAPAGPVETALGQKIAANIHGKQGAIAALASKSPVDALRAALPVTDHPLVDSWVQEVKGKLPPGHHPQELDPIVDVRAKRLLDITTNPLQ